MPSDDQKIVVRKNENAFDSHLSMQMLLIPVGLAGWMDFSVLRIKSYHVSEFAIFLRNPTEATPLYFFIFISICADAFSLARITVKKKARVGSVGWLLQVTEKFMFATKKWLVYR